jgi:hypothetical protein
MVTAVKGIYENGRIFLDEKLSSKKARVLVAVIEEINEKPKKKRKLGTMKGQFKMSDDFNEPLDELKDYM